MKIRAMKKLMNYTAIAVSMMAFLSASTLNAQEWTKEQMEVWKKVEQKFVKWQEGDYDAAFASLHEKYIGWNNHMPLPTTKDKWVNSASEMKGLYKLTYYDIEPARILVYGDVAVVHYYYDQSFTYTKGDEIKEFNAKGKYTEFLIKEKGKWFIIGDMTYRKDEK